MLIDSVNTYLSIRRRLGFKLKTVERYLTSYANFASTCGDTHIVSKTAIEWAAQASSEAARARCLGIVTRFSYFMRVEDSRHELPPDKIFCGRWHRRTPYIFTDQEVVQLILQAKRLAPTGSLRPHTYSTLFGLLASIGLRISEALSLHLEDIRCEGLVIRETKFKKSRIVPLHQTAVVVLDRYLKHRARCGFSDNHVFVSHREGTQLRYSNVVETFQKLLRSAGIEASSHGHRPRLHDLRHRICIKALESCPDSRDRVTRHMLAISTYMGHARMESTYWYLENTPHLMNDIVRSCELFMHQEVT